MHHGPDPRVVLVKPEAHGPAYSRATALHPRFSIALEAGYSPGLAKSDKGLEFEQFG